MLNNVVGYYYGLINQHVMEKQIDTHGLSPLFNTPIKFGSALIRKDNDSLNIFFLFCSPSCVTNVPSYTKHLSSFYSRWEMSIVKITQTQTPVAVTIKSAVSCSEWLMCAARLLSQYHCCVCCWCVLESSWLLWVSRGGSCRISDDWLVEWDTPE